MPGVLDSGTQQATRRVGTLRMVPVTGDELSVRTGRIVMVRSFEVQTYIVIDYRQDCGNRIEAVFGDADRCKVTDGVWFVRSPRLATSEVASDLGIEVGTRSGIVAAISGYDGVAERRVVEKLTAWERAR